MLVYARKRYSVDGLCTSQEVYCRRTHPEYADCFSRWSRYDSATLNSVRRNRSLKIELRPVRLTGIVSNASSVVEMPQAYIMAGRVA